MVEGEVQVTEVSAEAEVSAPEVAVDTAQAASAPAESRPQEPDHAQETKKALKGVQKRIDELTRARYEAEERGKQEAETARQEALYWRQQAEQLNQKIGPPRSEQFTDYEQYLSALAAHEASKATSEQFRAAQREQAEFMQRQANENQARQAYATYQNAIKETVTKASEKFPDFMDVVTGPELPNIAGTPAFNAILESEIGGEVLYYLGKNPARAHQIASLSPINQVREIGRIEAALSTGKTVTSAPPPPGKVSSGESAATKDPNRMSYDEFVAWRRKTIDSKRGR